MDFRERQEAVAVAAVIDEGRLQRRLDARDLGEIDVAAKLLAVGGLEVEFLDAVAAQHDHPGLLRMGRVDEHFVGHWKSHLGRRQERARTWRRGRAGAPARLGLKEGGRAFPRRAGGAGARRDAKSSLAAERVEWLLLRSWQHETCDP